MPDQKLRAGISRETVRRDVETPKTVPHSFGFRPGVDLDKLNQLADELEAEAAAESLKGMGLMAADSPDSRPSRRQGPQSVG